MAAVYLDPDYRKWPDMSKPWCIRCQKPIKDVTKAIECTVMDVHVSLGGSDLIGKDCAKKIGLTK